MIKPSQLIVFGALASTVALAGTWSGSLVDFECYARDERNITKDQYVEHDGDFEIRQCTPNVRTKSFAVVQQSGEMFKLDTSGNAKAAELVGASGKKSRLHVTITGEMSKDTVRVDSIAVDR
jgi:hypothetical protein